MPSRTAPRRTYDQSTNDYQPAVLPHSLKQPLHLQIGIGPNTTSDRLFGIIIIIIR